MDAPVPHGPCPGRPIGVTSSSSSRDQGHFPVVVREADPCESLVRDPLAQLHETEIVRIDAAPRELQRPVQACGTRATPQSHEVREALTRMGVDPADAQRRADRLTDAEVVAHTRHRTTATRGGACRRQKPVMPIFDDPPETSGSGGFPSLQTGLMEDTLWPTS